MGLEGFYHVRFYGPSMHFYFYYLYVVRVNLGIFCHLKVTIIVVLKQHFNDSRVSDKVRLKLMYSDLLLLELHTFYGVCIQ